MDNDSIFIDGGFDPEWYESKIQVGMGKDRRYRVPMICETHKKRDLGYLAWHAWADEMEKKGIKQEKCPKCKHWLFPEEM